MVEKRRRNPLVLTSTKNLINSVLSEGHRVDGSGDGDASTSLQLPPGILRLSKDRAVISSSPKLASLDDSALVGLSTPALKRLSITSGSLIPECGTLDSIKGNSSIEYEDRQEMIDLALHNYFGVDRYLARGDIFSICINWSCKSSMCIPCKQGSQAGSDNIYFKVVAMEPSDDPSLRVNHSQTALVLGGSVSSSVPPDLWIAEQQGFAPLQGDTVKILASILTPPLCPSALSSKFRVSVLLYGLAGCWEDRKASGAVNCSC